MRMSPFCVFQLFDISLPTPAYVFCACMLSLTDAIAAANIQGLLLLAPSRYLLKCGRAKRFRSMLLWDLHSCLFIEIVISNDRT